MWIFNQSKLFTIQVSVQWMACIVNESQYRNYQFVNNIRFPNRNMKFCERFSSMLLLLPVNELLLSSKFGLLLSLFIFSFFSRIDFSFSLVFRNSKLRIKYLFNVRARSIWKSKGREKLKKKIEKRWKKMKKEENWRNIEWNFYSLLLIRPMNQVDKCIVYIVNCIHFHWEEYCMFFAEEE